MYVGMVKQRWLHKQKNVLLDLLGVKREKMVTRSPHNPMLICVCFWIFGLTWFFVTVKVDGNQLIETFHWRDCTNKMDITLLSWWVVFMGPALDLRIKPLDVGISFLWLNLKLNMAHQLSNGMEIVVFVCRQQKICYLVIQTNDRGTPYLLFWEISSLPI
jgi:hypothetical protein